MFISSGCVLDECFRNVHPLEVAQREFLASRKASFGEMVPVLVVTANGATEG
jgi:hypothetical protein